MELQNRTYNIKLPSSAVVNHDSLWKFIKTIVSTGDVFTKEDLKQQGLYTKSDDTIKRTLSYLKYLGLLDESRVTEKKGQKSGSIQKFTLKDKVIINDLKFELKANRESEARIKWQKLLSDSDLYLAIKNDFFQGKKNKTRVDLEHFLRERSELKNNDATHILNGAKFIISLFNNIKLIEEKGNDLICIENKQKTEIDSDKKEEKSTQFPIGEVDKSAPNGTNYIMTITGPDINTQITIKGEIDFTIIDGYIKKIKTNLKIDDTK